MNDRRNDTYEHGGDRSKQIIFLFEGMLLRKSNISCLACFFMSFRLVFVLEGGLTRVCECVCVCVCVSVCDITASVSDARAMKSPGHG